MNDLKNCICGKVPELKTSQVGIYTCSLYECCGRSSECFQASPIYAVSDWNDLMEENQKEYDIKLVAEVFKMHDSPRGEAARRILGIEEVHNIEFEAAKIKSKRADALIMKLWIRREKNILKRKQLNKSLRMAVQYIIDNTKAKKYNTFNELYNKYILRGKDELP